MSAAVGCRYLIRSVCWRTCFCRESASALSAFTSFQISAAQSQLVYKEASIPLLLRPLPAENIQGEAVSFSWLLDCVEKLSALFLLSRRKLRVRTKRALGRVWGKSVLRRTMQSMKRLSRGNYKLMEYLILYRCGEKVERGTELERSLGGATNWRPLAFSCRLWKTGAWEPAVGAGTAWRGALQEGGSVRSSSMCPLLVSQSSKIPMVSSEMMA